MAEEEEVTVIEGFVIECFQCQDRLEGAANLGFSFMANTVYRSDLGYKYSVALKSCRLIP